METRAHHVLIGLFTLLALAAALLFALWLAKSSVDRENIFYDVIFREAVTGLSKGSAVQYSGIKVGEVTELQLDPEDPRRVRARIRLAGSTPVKQDTRAKLALTGITGAAIIQLTSGTPESPRLQTSPERVAQIFADPSPIARLLANGGDLMTSINKLLHSANHILSPQNAQRIGQTLEHLEQTTGAIAEQRETFGQALRQLAGAAEQSNLAMTQMTALLQRGNILLDQQGRSILDDAGSTMAALERSSRQIERLLDDNQQALSTGAQGLNELGPALRELRGTLKSLQSVSRQLENNPADYLLGRDKVREFQP